MEDNHEIREIPVEITDDRHAGRLMRGDDVHVGQPFEYATNFVQDQKNVMRMKHLGDSEAIPRARALRIFVPLYAERRESAFPGAPW